ncbi:hypothetical protein FE257_005501 [Aspergillus nanangensis]|uniref:Uncharacterized protein n=1 Tax=Aspergillus nanangensis TaxID=2582783 RepID=A0AAD4CA84_ASPNN|nr:hypothetical protein FE257_005501 [Aspergillus nanangensis]
MTIRNISGPGHASSPSDVQSPQTLAPPVHTTTNYVAAGQEYPRVERKKIMESTSANEVTSFVGLFDMDSGRTSALKSVQGRLGTFSASEAIILVGLFDMDSGRTSALKAVQGKLGTFSASETMKLIGLFDMDAGRCYAQNIVCSLSCTVDRINLPRLSTTTPTIAPPTGRVNITQRSFRNYGNAVQFDVSNTGGRTGQVSGYLSNESLQQLSRDFTN